MTDAEADPMAGTVQCPWCPARHMKDPACNWVCCGLITGPDGKERFLAGYGCGHQYCFKCGKKLCTRVFGADGAKLSGKRNHDGACCVDDGTYCPGGHNAHCAPRW